MATPRKPQDRNRPGSDSLFYWTAPDGTELSLPKMASLGAGLVRKYRKLADVDFLFSVLEAVMTEDELGTLDRLALVDVNKLFAAWQEDAGASIPQS
jgi:hypothetical protein